MKRIVAVALAAVVGMALISPAAHAQVTPQFGLEAGLTLAKLSYDPEPAGLDLKVKAGARFGAIIGVNVQPMIGIESGLIFSMDGVKNDVTGGTEKVKLNYLRVPVLIQLAPPMAGSIKPFVKVGPEVGFLVSAKAEDVNGDETDIKDNLKSTDFGLDFIGGVGMPFANVNGFIQAGYYLGLTDINDVANVDTKTKNRIITISVGVKMM